MDSDSSKIHGLRTLELRRAAFADGDYELSKWTEVPYLYAHGVRLARVEWDESDVPTLSAGQTHVLFDLGDYLGSTSVVLDQATSEVVERGTYQAYGGAESDYRPERWKGFREDYRFTGKEEDVEVGLQYFGKRYYAPLLNRWVSADPLAVHEPGKADLNPYAYVRGHALRNVDPRGLDDAKVKSEKTTVITEESAVNLVQDGRLTTVDREKLVHISIDMQLTRTKAAAAPRSAAPAPSPSSSGSTAPSAPVTLSETYQAFKKVWGTMTGQGGIDILMGYQAKRQEEFRGKHPVVAGVLEALESTQGIGLGVAYEAPAVPRVRPPARILWKPGPHDVDWRGTGKTFREALDEAFRRTGVDREQFEETQWGKDKHGKSFPVEWRAPGGAEVSVDLGHTTAGPDSPHVGYQQAGKRSAGAVRGHILVDEVPYNR